MENLMMVYGKPTSEDRYEELNLWYTWEHIGDELINRACLAAQRFELSKYQPRNADTSFPVLCLYEVVDRDYCLRWHMKDARTWRMKISTALSREFYETFWNPVAKTSDWAEYADYRGERAVMTVKIKARGDMDPRDYFTVEKLRELRRIPGMQTLHFFDWLPEHQMANSPKEYCDYNLVCQISNCYMVAAEWDKYLDAHPEMEEKFEMFPAIFEPMMPRIRDVDVYKYPEWRAIRAITSLLQDDHEGRMLPMFTEEEKRASLSEDARAYTDIPRRNFRDDTGVGG